MSEQVTYLPPDFTDVTEIVDFARSDSGKQVMDQVEGYELPSEVDTLVKQYSRLQGSRNTFIWKWVHQLAPQFTFPIVLGKHQSKVRDVKTIATLFLTLLDDILEKEQDRDTFQEAHKAPFPHQTIVNGRDGVDYTYVQFTNKVWEWLETNLKTAPEYETYEEWFKYDLRQSIAAIEYSYLATSNPGVTTLEEHVRRESHNMMMYPYADIDLMFGKEQSTRDVAILREAVWNAQLMARIGNWLSTWERELREGDFSSGIVVYALQQGVISKQELMDIKTDDTREYDTITQRIRETDVEQYFFTMWTRSHENLKEIDRQSISIDIQPYIQGMKVVLAFHLASQGMK